MCIKANLGAVPTINLAYLGRAFIARENCGV